MNSTISKTITTNASASTVWSTLTNPDLIKLWFWESKTTVLIDWVVGNPVVSRGDFHGMVFETKGRVLQFVPERLLRYTISERLTVNLIHKLCSHSGAMLNEQLLDNRTLIFMI